MVSVFGSPRLISPVLRTMLGVKRCSSIVCKMEKGKKSERQEPYPKDTSITMVIKLFKKHSSSTSCVLGTGISDVNTQFPLWSGQMNNFVFITKKIKKRKKKRMRFNTVFWVRTPSEEVLKLTLTWPLPWRAHWSLVGEHRAHCGQSQ